MMKEKKFIDKPVIPIVTLEAIDLYSPIPVLHLKKEITKIKKGDVIQINSTDLGMAEDLDSWCKNNKNIYMGEKKGDKFTMYFVMKD